MQFKLSSAASFYEEVKFVKAKNQPQSRMMDLAETNVLTNLHKSGEDEKNLLIEQDYSLAKEQTKHEPPAIFKKIIIDPSFKPVEIFQLMIILFSMLTTLFAAYFACFGEPENESVYYLDMFMEICFIIDIVKNFFLMYTDPTDPSK